MSQLVRTMIASFFSIIAGVLLLREGLKRKDFESTMRFIHYRPIKNYGKTYCIVVGVFFILVGIWTFLKDVHL